MTKETLIKTIDWTQVFLGFRPNPRQDKPRHRLRCSSFIPVRGELELRTKGTQEDFSNAEGKHYEGRHAADKDP